MKVETHVKQGVLVAVLSGELDLGVADRLRAELDGALERTGANSLLLDLSGVSFIDSSGLGVILGRYRRLSRNGGTVMVTGARPQVRRILELSGLLRVIEERPSVEGITEKTS